ncbi:acetyltransferase [Marinomonas ostreistagni]|uniref:acetyltransferase n=1 Tax=Marinomonas ostreistagni TaxID=359209 RepID=UPI0019505343|nr:acetyltransferase [Marinomonas ostreistagni]MBM6551162.1 1-acyl-sn-glycerol-3-phosphate acyltransferase [Marinomonas ostreistagni]
MQPFIGLLSFLFVSSNILLCGIAIHLVALVQWLWRKPNAWARPWYDRCYQAWVSGCTFWFTVMLDTRWQLDDWQPPTNQQWHLVIANHRSWVDVFILLAQLNGRVPMPRIFMKDTLFWLPLVGTATKLMGFPQVKRYSKAVLAKRPELAQVDRQTTAKACAPLLAAPSSVLSFAEGTRFSARKHADQASPYQQLLRPKAGGVWMVLNAMPQRFDTITDVNIAYFGEAPSYWDLLCGRAIRAYVKVRDIDIPAPVRQLQGEQDKSAFFDWFNAYWQDKDRHLVADLGKCSKLEMSQKDTIKKGKGLQS